VFGLGDEDYDNKSYEPTEWCFFADFMSATEWDDAGFPAPVNTLTVFKDVDWNDPEQLRALYRQYSPGGSGPLGMMRAMVDLLRVIANDRGIKLDG
jgi:hypothetical protein